MKRAGEGALPIKVLKGPRQVGKTALLKTHTDHSIVYLDDTATRALAVRMQGWTNIEQLLVSPLAGQLFENMVCGELLRFFINSAKTPQISFARSKEKVEVDFLIDLGNMRYLAIEAKTTPCSYTTKQHALLDSLDLNIVERWIVSPTPAPDFPRCRVVVINELWNALMAVMV